MKIITTQYCCPYCKRVVASEQTGFWGSFGMKKEIIGRCALKLELGYSIGGWGRRENFMPAINSEYVCVSCFEVIEQHALALKKALELRAAYPDEKEDTELIKNALFKSRK